MDEKMERFKLCDFDEVVKLGLEDVNDYHRDEVLYRNFVVEFRFDGPKIVGSDGGEPEDQLLYRDWRWVVPALNAAYIDGLQESHKERG